MADREGLCFDLNENTGGCSPRVAERLKSLTANEIARYPHRESGESLVAEFLGVKTGQVLLTNGLDEGLFLLASTYLGTGDEMVFAEPTFVTYRVVGDAVGACVIRLRMGHDFSFPTGELLKRISPATRLIAIANPNNPTGQPVPKRDLLQIVEAAEHAAVLIDEAYFEFCGQTILAEVERRSNLFVARTFSKAYGLAGLRLGALVGPAEQIEYTRRFVSPFNVNAAALACLRPALEDQEFVRGHVEEIKKGRERFVRVCEALGLKAWPSQANFVLVKIGPRCNAFVEAMRRDGIVIRDMSASPGCDGCARITIGTAAEFERLADAMREILRRLGSGSLR